MDETYNMEYDEIRNDNSRCQTMISNNKEADRKSVSSISNIKCETENKNLNHSAMNMDK